MKGEKKSVRHEAEIRFYFFAQRLVEAAEEAHHEHEENPDLQVRLRLVGVKKRKENK